MAFRHTCIVIAGLLAMPSAADGWEEDARAGIPEAMAKLAWRLEQGGDREAALAWYLRAAEAGSPEAQYHLAQSYLNNGLGVFDAELAQYWYGRVREQGICPSVIRAPDAL